MQLGGDKRKKGDGVGEYHSGQVHEIRAQQVAAANGIAKALPYAGQCRRGSIVSFRLDPGQRAKPGQRSEGKDVRERVQSVSISCARTRDKQPA